MATIGYHCCGLQISSETNQVGFVEVCMSSVSKMPAAMSFSI
jgi:hypothetical protein